jgi:methylase of polypeptide subunit release factors
LLLALYEQAYEFTTITPLSHRVVNSRSQNAWATDLQGVLGWSRPFKTGVLAEDIFEVMRSAGILEQIDGGWQSKIRVSSIDHTLFAHSAFPTEENDAVFFGPDTYRFIRELHLTLDQIKSPIKRGVDIGTGTGAAAILTAAALPEAKIYGIDINRHALDLANANAKAAGCANVSFQYSNLLNEVEGEFDFIMANPPYLVDGSKRSYRHGDGPLGAKLSLDIVDTAIARLSPGGTLYLYTGVAIVNGKNPFLDEIIQKVRLAGYAYDYAEIDPDIFGEELQTDTYAMADRIAAVRLLIKAPF